MNNLLFEMKFVNLDDDTLSLVKADHDSYEDIAETINIAIEQAQSSDTFEDLETLKKEVSVKELKELVDGKIENNQIVIAEEPENILRCVVLEVREIGVEENDR